MEGRSSHFGFLVLALSFEGGLALVAIACGWLLKIDPLSSWHWNSRDCGVGLLATLPMLAGFFVSMRFPLGPLRAIREFLLTHLGPLLSRCTWYELLLIAALAGLGEEMLFRGLLQPLLGMAGSNIIFGLLHSVTPAYAVIAGLIGLYLGWLQQLTGNLLTPVVTHAVYDYVAFLAVVKTWRESDFPGMPPPEAEEVDPP